MKAGEFANLTIVSDQIREEHPTLSARKMYFMLNLQTMGRDSFEQFCTQNVYNVPRKRNFFRTTNSLGADKKAIHTISTLWLELFWAPMATIAGTLLGGAALTFFINQVTLKELLAVGSGFGYYSLSSVIFTELHSVEPGVVSITV